MLSAVAALMPQLLGDVRRHRREQHQQLIDRRGEARIAHDCARLFAQVTSSAR